VIVSDESGIDQKIQSLCFVAGPGDAIRALNHACKDALASAKTSEIKFKDIDDSRKNRAARQVLPTFLDCPHCRAMVLSWNLLDSRHQVERRDDRENFHRMLFHGLRSVADWFGDVDWYWYHDEKTDLVQSEILEFLNNTRGYKALANAPVDLFGDYRHMIRVHKAEQRSSKQVALLGLADLFAGAVRHSVWDSPGCLQTYRDRGGQTSLDLADAEQVDKATKALSAKRQMVAHIRDLCGQRKLGVSLESSSRLATHKKGSKVWFWHYEPQGKYDQAPTK